MARLLLIEDDDDIRAALRLFLEGEGHFVGEAASGEEGVEAFNNDPWDLVLVDLLLPGMHGLEVCRAVRAQSTVPMIVITAQSDTHDVVAGLEAGADDYLVKPVAPKELAARIRAALRRMQMPVSAVPGAALPPRVVIADVEIDEAGGEVFKAGKRLDLTRTEFRLLIELVSAPNQVLTREVLLERVWGYDYLGESRLVDTHVYRLRAKVEDNPAEPILIHTVRGLGYKLILPRP